MDAHGYTVKVPDAGALNFYKKKGGFYKKKDGTKPGPASDPSDVNRTGSAGDGRDR